MTEQQINQLLTQIVEFQKIDLEEHFSKAYPNQSNLSDVLISRMNVLEFINLSKRLITQLEKEISGLNKIVLPYTFSTPEFGQSDVFTTLSNLNSYIRSNQFPHAENSLLWLAHYQLQNGFYDKSQVKVHPISSIELKKTSDALSILTTDLKKLQETYTSLMKEVEAQKKALSDFKIQKETELQQITNNLSTSNTNTSQIQNLLNNSTQSESRINSILSEVEKNKLRIEATEENISSTFTKFKTDYSELIAKIATSESNFLSLYSDFEQKHAFVVSKHQYFSDRNEYLDSLIGREVGASLFETFKQRKTELNSPLNMWRWAVGILGALTFVVILAIFTNFFGVFGPYETALKWENVLVNALKSLPFFFLLYYAIAQYNKERNFQEEYAFKSAAALTIKAYADILKDDKNKDELILKAVYGIYRSPINSKSKNIREVNSAFDMVGDIVDKGVSLVNRKNGI